MKIRLQLIVIITLTVQFFCCAQEKVKILKAIGPLVIVELPVANKNLKFLLDTGSNANFINEDSLDQFGAALKRDKSIDQMVNTFNSKKKSSGYRLELKIGKLSFENMKSYAMDTMKFDLKQDGIECCDGILGGEFLSKYPVNVDISKNEVKFIDGSYTAQVKSLLKLKVNVEGYQTLTLGCSFDNQPVKLRLDTGNEIPLIFQKFSTEKFFLRERLLKSGYTGKGLPFFKPKSFNCNGYTLDNLTATYFASSGGALAQKAVDINAGGHFLGEHYLLDYKKKEIYISKKPMEFTANIVSYKLPESFEQITGHPSTIDQALALTAKACSESDKSGECLKYICTFQERNCSFTESSNPLYDFITYRFPIKSIDCSTSRLVQELRSNPIRYNFCWYKLYQLNKSEQKDSLVIPLATRFEKFKKNMNDFKILQIRSLEKMSAKYYCFSVFKNLIDFKTLPASLFALSVEGLSFYGSEIKEYKKWLKTKDSKSCQAHLADQLGLEIDSELVEKDSILINPYTIIGHGVRDFKSNLTRVLNHEFLHLLYASKPEYAKRAQKEWNSLSDLQKKDFIKEHPSYDFAKQNVLFKEFFSYKYQMQLEKL